uniref:chitin synthase n=1 Tax=Timema shepardi TaxID=629360 RepID=A0A7R9FXV5_TIMSH|nr:unnamed protein product [Timema shepardi]
MPNFDPSLMNHGGHPVPTPMEEDNGYDSMDSSGLSSPDHVITVYACATMWHETRTEMLGFVGSIEKLDENNSNRNIDFDDDGKYFNLEVHIFFDDAFTNTANGPSFNIFVKNLVSVVEQTFGASVHPPRNIETPYGGRLEYSLPGHTAMLVHLKDRNRIRHGKRWSQVMYMSYLLTHRLNHSAGNTFILTLDGDVSFSPVSVHHLVDVMRRDNRIGSVCGRLHASGSAVCVHHLVDVTRRDSCELCVSTILLTSREGTLVSCVCVHHLVDVTRRDSSVCVSTILLTSREGTLVSCVCVHHLVDVTRRDSCELCVCVQHLVDVTRRDSCELCVCVQHLVDVKRRDSCFLVWSQKFEYHVGHWLQKCAENVLGGVLCSPGCFSLFRGSALMEILEVFSQDSSEAIQFVQRNQGEDRWLTTLILKRGHHVKYTPSSIAYTQCPETFDEFFNQRRRWIPSEYVNIVDIIINQFKCETNTKLNRFFTIYHLLVLISSFLCPTGVFLLLVHSFAIVFRQDGGTSMRVNALAVSCFIVLCCFCNRRIQLMSAKLLSVMYGLLILSTIIVIVVDLFRYGLASDLRSLFFVVVMHHLFFVVILYPTEVTKCKTILPFYVTSPTRLLLLPVFTVFNIQDVTWGTRETQVPNEMNERTSCNFGKVSKTSLRTTWRKVVSNMKQIISNSYGDVPKFTKTSSNLNFIERVPGSYCIEVDNTKSSELMEHNDTQPGNTSFISNEESQFWSDIIRKYLHPIDGNKENKMKVYNDLCRLRYILASVFIIGNGFFIYLLAPKVGNMSSVVYNVDDKGSDIGTAVGLIPFIVSVVTLFVQTCAVTIQRLVTFLRCVVRSMYSRTSWRISHV